MKRRVLVIGARGLVGGGVIQSYEADAEWSVIAISRQKPLFPNKAKFISLDLTDRVAVLETLGMMGRFDRIVYAALYEKADLIAGWSDQNQIATNVAMLTNVLDAMGSTTHFTLLQGTKAYGAHLGPMRNPGKESDARTDGPNFYWPQEDLLKERAKMRGFAFNIHRPQIISGLAVGSPMNVALAVGVYAALTKAAGDPLCFPGGRPFITQMTDAGLLGRAIRWAADNEKCWGQTFNVTNGDELVWRSIWPAIADVFDMPLGEDTRQQLAATMPKRTKEWAVLVRKQNLVPLAMDQLVGGSWQFADAVFGYAGANHTLLSTIKIRQYGFVECMDTEIMFRTHLRALQNARILPK